VFRRLGRVWDFFFERRSSRTGFSDTVCGNICEIVEEFSLAFGDGIPIQSGEIADKGDTIMPDGEGEESGNVSLVAFVESLKQQSARGLVVSEIVLNHLGSTHGSSLMQKLGCKQYNTSEHFLKYQFDDLI